MLQTSPRLCWRCGTSTPANQPYCANCGVRLDGGFSNASLSSPGEGSFSAVSPPPGPYAQPQQPPRLQEPSQQFQQGYPPQQNYQQPPSAIAQGQAAPYWASLAPPPQAPQFGSVQPQIQSVPTVPGVPYNAMPPGQASVPQPSHVAPGQADVPHFSSMGGHAGASPAGQAAPSQLGNMAPAQATASHAASAAHKVSSLSRATHQVTHKVSQFSLKAKLVAMATVVVMGASAAAVGYYQYRSTAPTSFVIATDRGNAQIVRIDIATRKTTVLLSSKVLPGAPDSAVFMNATQMLIDFTSGGQFGIGDIQKGTYTPIAPQQGTLRDMALRPDGSSMLIADVDTGAILEFHVANHAVTTFAQNLGGVQGLAFAPDGALYAAVGSQIVQLDPGTGKQLKTFTLPSSADGMAYDQHRNTLDIASGDAILTLNPKTGGIGRLIDGISTTDGVAIDRQGNLFIAANPGILELTTSNQLLMVGTDAEGMVWDDVTPLSGSGAADY